MSESSNIVFILMGEGLLVLLVGIAVALFFQGRSRKRDRHAARQLVEQIKHQSETRRATTGAFLQEKYHFEGAELKKAIDAIEQSEKKFFQKVINIYLKRDAEALESLDASVAEMIDVYKSLSPVMPEPTESVETGDNAELEELRAANKQLEDELKITKNTMSNMIEEFGNMFAGGADNEMSQNEVLEQVSTENGDSVEDDGAEQVT